MRDLLLLKTKKLIKPKVYSKTFCNNKKKQENNKSFESNLKVRDSNQKKEIAKYGTRRSSRKATIERRVWAEPRKDKITKLQKESNNNNKRGRPPKNIPVHKSVNMKKQLLVLQKNKLVKNRFRGTTNNCPTAFSRKIENEQKKTKVQMHQNLAGAIDPCSSFCSGNSDNNLVIDDDCMTSLQSEVEAEVVTEPIIDYNKPPTKENIVDHLTQKLFGNRSPQYKRANEGVVLKNGTLENDIVKKSILEIPAKFDRSKSIPNASSYPACNSWHNEKHLEVNTKNDQFPKSGYFSKKKSKKSLENVCDFDITPDSIQSERSLVGKQFNMPDYFPNSVFLSNENKVVEEKKTTIEDMEHPYETEHVSLSEALAKLVDSDNSKDASETVTIHPVNNFDASETVSSKAESCLADSPLNEFPEVLPQNELPEVLLQNEFPEVLLQNEFPEVLSQNEFKMRHTDTPDKITIPKIEEKKPAEIQSTVNTEKRNIELFGNVSSNCIQSNGNVVSDHSDILDTQKNSSPTLDTSSNDSSAEESTADELPFHMKQPPPALIRVPTRPPVIRTPLQCSECPMRFCTVRSLLWHFGTHETSVKHNPPVRNLLEDLQVAWDKPDVPLQLTNDHLQNSKNKVESLPKSHLDGSSSVNGDFILKVPVPRLGLVKKYESVVRSQEQVSSITSPTVTTSPKTTNILSANTACNFTNSLRSSPICNESESTSTKAIRAISPKRCIDSSVSQSDKLCSKSANCSPSYSLSSNLADLCSHSKTSLYPSTKTTSSRPEFKKQSVTIIPIENMDHLKDKISSQTTNSLNFHSDDVEKDALVMINRNLGLRMISSNPSTTSELSNKTSMDIDNIHNESYSSLTIFSQCKSIDLGSNTKTFDGPVPDILTIVPQKNPSKNYVSSSNDSKDPEIMTATGKMSADSSQIVKLVLIPSKENAIGEVDGLNSNVKPNFCKDNGISFSNTSFSDHEYDSDEESDDGGGMVIDFKEDGEDTSMDPLSMCAVTMEDAEGSSVIHSSESLSTATSSSKSDMAKKSCKVDAEKYQRRKYVCQYCQKRFGWSTDLKRHVILHTGERPFKCKWCPITFTRKFLLQNHMKKIHTDVCKWSDLWE